MEINNKNLNRNERQWLSTLLSKQFSKKEEFIKQINSAEINREYDRFFLSIRFNVDKKVGPINNIARVPVEMRVYSKGVAPVQFLLHVVEGYISELEVFCADSSEIDAELELGEAEKIEFILEN